MSNTLAIGAATATLRILLAQGIAEEGGGLHVTTLPPDKAQTFGQNDGSGRLNLFLYQTQINTAWRNLDMPRQVRSGETGQPPVTLDLFYLVTAHEQQDGDASVLAHRLLGRAMRVLHDHPVLGADEIRLALPDNDLADQIERLRITPQPMSLDELSKLWMIFQAGYRISAAYQVSVVLVDSTRSARAPLPVLRRGDQDQGVTAVALPPPTLLDVRPDVQPAGSQPGVKLGDGVIISGQNLPGSGVVVRFTRQSSPAPPGGPEVVALALAAGGTDSEIAVALPNDAGAMTQWAPGFYTVSLLLTTPGLPAWATNEVPVALLPVITVAPILAPPGDLTLTVTSAPRLRDGQRVQLLFGDRQIPAKTISNPADATKPTTLTFFVPAAVAGKYVVRLRVDGVDSFPVLRSGTPPVLGFDPNQTVVIA